MAPVVQSILASVREQVLTAPAFDPTQASRNFTVALPEIGEMVFLPKLLSHVMAEAPSVNIRSVSMPPRKLMLALQRAEVDLAIGYFPDIDGVDFLQQRLFRDGFVCLVRGQH